MRPVSGNPQLVRDKRASESAIHQFSGEVFRRVHSSWKSMNRRRLGKLDIVYAGKWFLRSRKEIWKDLNKRQRVVAAPGHCDNNGDGDASANKNNAVVDFVSLETLMKLRGEI